jgi:hypothetical protein
MQSSSAAEEDNRWQISEVQKVEEVIVCSKSRSKTFDERKSMTGVRGPANDLGSGKALTFKSLHPVKLSNWHPKSKENRAIIDASYSLIYAGWLTLLLYTWLLHVIRGPGRSCLQGYVLQHSVRLRSHSWAAYTGRVSGVLGPRLKRWLWRSRVISRLLSFDFIKLWLLAFDDASFSESVSTFLVNEIYYEMIQMVKRAGTLYWLSRLRSQISSSLWRRNLSRGNILQKALKAVLAYDICILTWLCKGAIDRY